MHKRFVDAGAAGTLRDLAARAPHRFFTSGIAFEGHAGSRVTSVQHRDVVEVIAGRESLFARDFVRRDNSSERGAFVIIRMAKAQVNGVALIMKFRMLRWTRR